MTSRLGTFLPLSATANSSCKLQRMPSAAIKSSSGKLVAHVMVDPAGFINHHFVSEVHRREGLGTVIEIKIAQRCVKYAAVRN